MPSFGPRINIPPTPVPTPVLIPTPDTNNQVAAFNLVDPANLQYFIDNSDISSASNECGINKTEIQESLTAMNAALNSATTPNEALDIILGDEFYNSADVLVNALETATVPNIDCALKSYLPTQNKDHDEFIGEVCNNLTLYQSEYVPKIVKTAEFLDKYNSLINKLLQQIYKSLEDASVLCSLDENQSEKVKNLMEKLGSVIAKECPPPIVCPEAPTCPTCEVCPPPQEAPTCPTCEVCPYCPPPNECPPAPKCPEAPPCPAAVCQETVCPTYPPEKTCKKSSSFWFWCMFVLIIILIVVILALYFGANSKPNNNDGMGSTANIVDTVDTNVVQAGDII